MGQSCGLSPDPAPGLASAETVYTMWDSMFWRHVGLVAAASLALTGSDELVRQRP
jgi:hypothetical protein